MTTMSSDPDPAKPLTPPESLLQLRALYPNHYTWFLLFSALDIMLTHTILGRFGAFGGRELNSIADIVIKAFGLWGAIGLKFATVILAVAIVEYIGRRRPFLGKRLANFMVIVSIFPVAWEIVLLLWFAITHNPATIPH